MMMSRMNFMTALGVVFLVTSTNVGRAQDAAVKKLQVHSSDSDHPQIDTVKQGRHYYSDCHLEIEASEVPTPRSRRNARGAHGTRESYCLAIMASWLRCLIDELSGKYF